MPDRVAIVGVGQTKQTYHKPEVNAEEMINEAVRAALEDAGLTIKDIDAVIPNGNMQWFEGHYLPDCMMADGAGAWMKPGIRIETGGTTGGTITCAGFNLVASGLFDKVLVIGWEKLDAASFPACTSATREPTYDRHINVAAASFLAAEGVRYMEDTGCPEEIASLSRAIISEGASRNPYTQARKRLSAEEVMNSRVIVWPLRFYHIAPTSCGACALILASEKEAKKARKPVWIRDYVVVHRETAPYRGGAVEPFPSPWAVEEAAIRLYKRNGIINPAKEIDVWETYTPSSWKDMPDLEKMHICEKGQGWRLIEKGMTRFDREIPWNPSGGLVCSNPIGASGALRVLEATLQLRGEAGEHQVHKDVKLAEAHAYGGTHWCVMLLLGKSPY